MIWCFLGFLIIIFLMVAVLIIQDAIDKGYMFKLLKGTKDLIRDRSHSGKGRS